MDLQCEHSEIERVIFDLYAEVNSSKAYIHKGAVIHENNMDLRVTADIPASQNEVLFKIPGACLAEIDKFHFVIEDDAICIRSMDDDLAESQKRICELIIELYNFGNKIRDYRRTSHWYALAPYPELLRHLIQGRPQKHYRQLWERGDTEKLLLEGFLGRRAMHMPGKGPAGSTPVLHPFVDFMNHHNKAPLFQVATNGNENLAGQDLWVVNTQSMFGINECLVCYILLDPFDSLLNYGFVERSGTVCKSVPMEIVLSNGLVIDIESNTVYNSRKILPPDLKGLYSFYIPDILQIDRSRSRLRLSHLMIPDSGTPNALRSVLTYSIEVASHDLSMNLSRTKLRDMVIKVEERIISENLKYYRKLLEMCSEIKGPDNVFLNMVKEMADLQVDWINNYEKAKV